MGTKELFVWKVRNGQEKKRRGENNCENMLRKAQLFPHHLYSRFWEITDSVKKVYNACTTKINEVQDILSNFVSPTFFRPPQIMFRAAIQTHGPPQTKSVRHALVHFKNSFKFDQDSRVFSKRAPMGLLHIQVDSNIIWGN